MNTWKLTTIGLALTGITATTTGLTTAYLLRPATGDSGRRLGDDGGIVPSASAAIAQPAPSIQPRVQPAVYRPQAATPVRTAATAPPARVATVSDPAAVDTCDTGGERAWRIAKPGLLGTLLGAGLGAAGGAIADGGEGAGKGAIVGGIAGAAVGTGYGAYKTKNECGTIFGGDTAATGTAPAIAPPVLARGESPLAPRAGDRIEVYRAR
jgi:hypothetical protein